MRFVITIITMLIATMGWAGNYRFQHVDSKSGLPHQQVEALAQDAKGYMWIGTRNGLARYDGYDIRTYYHTSQPHSLSHNFVHGLHVDRQNRLWITTENGISRYRPDSDDFCNYALEKGLFWSITESSQGDIFFGGNTLCRYDEQQDSMIIIPTRTADFVNSLAMDRNDNLFVATNSSIFSYDRSLTNFSVLPQTYFQDFMKGAHVIVPLQFDSSGRLWVGRNGQGAMCIDLKSGATKVYPAELLSSGIVRCITEDNRHRIWLGTEKGVSIIHPNGEIEVLRHHFADANSLSDNAIYTIFCDKASNIWLGSYFGGVDYLQNDNDQFLLFVPGSAPNQLKARVPRTIIETMPGTFWIATEDGGINIFDQTTNQFTQFSGLPATVNNVHGLFYDAATADIWIGTRFDGLYRYNLRTKAIKRYFRSNGLPSEACFSIAKQKSGRIWVATMEGLRYYDAQHDQFLPTGTADLDETFIYSLHIDRHDNLWASVINHGICRIDGKRGTVSSIKTSEGKGLKDNYIICLYQDSHGTLWIGNNNNGLQFMTPDGKIHDIESDVLSQCTICSIEEDKSGHLWISTSQGLFCYSPKTEAIVRFSAESNGLPSNQFNFASSLKALDGRMFFGTINGLIAFYPNDIKEKTGPFVVHLKRLTINDEVINTSSEDSPLVRELDETDKIELSYSQARSFSIDYSVIMPGNTSTINYQVWVEGIDRNWRNVGTERRFSGYNLSPGTYTLHIRANNTNRGWENCPEKVITIVVRPPFYRSTWAYAFYLLVLMTLLALIQRLFKVRMQERNAVRIANMEKEKLEELDEAKFDFFTTVSHELKTPLSLIIAPLKSMAKETMSEESRSHLDMIIKNANKMQELIGELVTFNKIETDHFSFYLQKGNPLEFIELGMANFYVACSEKGLNLSVSTENNGEEVWFSPSYVERILNNLVSNAIKFTPPEGSITVNACITVKNDSPYTYLRFQVKDTGIGIAKEEQENIFTRFYQTKRGFNANNSGWGIGLSLVKRLVDLHKGEVELDSTVGQGSTFTVWLNVSANAFPEKSLITDDKVIKPIDQYKFAQPAIMTSVDNAPLEQHVDNDRMSIMIVDDNADLLQYLRDYFSKDYNVLTATNGKEALQLAHEQQVQLVISDVMMPEMDGIELCRTLKADMQTSHIPVILLTAKSESNDVLEGYQSGAEAYVSKPFDPDILQLQVNNIMQLVEKRQKEIVDADSADIDATDTLGELDKSFVQKMAEIVEANLANSDFSITDITEALGVSRSLLHIKMKNILNMSMGDYIRKKRLDKACQMLQNGYNVSETAYSTGFSDPSYFSKTFKKHVGMSPTEYCSKKN